MVSPLESHVPVGAICSDMLRVQSSAAFGVMWQLDVVHRSEVSRLNCFVDNSCISFLTCFVVRLMYIHVNFIAEFFSWCFSSCRNGVYSLRLTQGFSKEGLGEMIEGIKFLLSWVFFLLSSFVFSCK